MSARTMRSWTALVLAAVVTSPACTSDDAPATSDTAPPADAALDAIGEHEDSTLPGDTTFDSGLETTGDSTSVDSPSIDGTSDAIGDSGPVPPVACGCGAGLKRCDQLAGAVVVNACVPSDEPRHGCGGASCAPCAVTNGVAKCSSGSCAIDRCYDGHADCDGVPTDCEVSTNDDDANCGSCGRACAAGLHCQAGTCAATCDPPLTTCTYGGVSTCTNLSTSIHSCGACRTGSPFDACAPATGQLPHCVGGACTFEPITCAAGLTLCGGECVDTATDPQNCHGCGVDCGGVRNGYAVCKPSGCEWCDPSAVTTGSALTHGCDAPATLPSAGTVIVDGVSATALVVDDTNVAYLAGNTLAIAPKAGGGPVVTLATDLASPQDLATNGVDVFVTERLGAAVTRIDVSTRAKTLFAVASEPSEIIADATHVYWITDGKRTLQRAPIGGGTPVTIVSSVSSGSPVTYLGLVQNAGFVALKIQLEGPTNFVSFDKTTLVEKDFAVASSTLGYAGGLAAIDATNVYWARSTDTSTDQGLKASPLVGGAPPPITFLLPQGIFDDVVAIDQAGTDLYGARDGLVGWIDRSCFQRWSNPLVRTSATFSAGRRAALDAAYFYWTDGTTIQRIARH